MEYQRVSISLAWLVSIVCVVLAAATIWLFLTNPVTVADAVNEGDVTPFVRELASVLFEAFKGLIKYL